MSVSSNTSQLSDYGWTRRQSAIPVDFCHRLVKVFESELEVPTNDLSRWDEYGRDGHDLLPIWGHQAQWDIRQHPQMHGIWAALWGAEKLWA